MEKRKVIIVGSGPAGYTAAIYASRAALSPLMIQGPQTGGQLMTTTAVENFPGFKDGIQGPELMSQMKEQAVKFHTEISKAIVTSANLKQHPFQIICSDKKEYLTDTLIIATGASAKYLNLDKEQSLIGRGVSACATCDAFFYHDKIVHVVGGGDTACEEACFLSKFASKVYLLHRRDSLRASKVLQKRVMDNPKIQIIWNTSVKELMTDDAGLSGLKVQDLRTEKITERKTDGFFLAIGHHPNTSFLQGQIECDSRGFIQTQPGTTQTSREGVFACGDVQDAIYRQAITAAGSGCMAAMSVEKFLEDRS